MKKIYSYLNIIAGALIASFSVACILLPNDAIDYGTAGIGILLSMVSGMNLSLAVMLVFLPFLVAGIFFLGKDFFFRALAGSAAYMLGLELFEKLPFVLDVEHFLAVAFGGALLGYGLSLILRSGGCIDGSEILANIIVNRISAKTGKVTNLTSILIVFNIFVYAAAFFLINKNSALLSLLVYVVATAVIDHFTDRFEAIKQVTIISKNPDSIIKWITTEMHKTCTVINSSGAIAGENKTVICYVSYFELQRLRESVKQSDSSAFITVSTIDEIMT